MPKTPEQLRYDSIEQPTLCPYCYGENRNPFAKYSGGSSIPKEEMRMKINCNHCDKRFEVVQIVQIRWEVDYE